MRTYILRRMLRIVPTVVMITLVVFVMICSIPGDPVVALLGDAYTEEDASRGPFVLRRSPEAAGAAQTTASWPAHSGAVMRRALPNNTLERAAGSHTLAAAAQRTRSGGQA